MDITTTKSHLDRALRYVAKATARDATLPIVQNILISVSGGIAHCAATNLDVGVRVRIAAKVVRDGAVVVSPTLLGSAIGVLSDDAQVRIVCDGGSVTVTGEMSRASLKGMDVSDFPPIPEMVNGGVTWSLERRIVEDSLRRVLPSVAKTEARPELGGVYMSAAEGRVFFVATDGFRLTEVAQDQKDIPDFAMIVPASAIAEIITVVGDGACDAVHFALDDGQLFVRCDDVMIVSRLIAGTYPDYKQIIPQSHGTVVRVARSDLERALRVAEVFAQRTSSSARLVVSAADGVLRVQAASQGSGEQQSTIAAEIDGEDQDVTINPRYGIDGIAHCGADTVILRITSATAPIVIQGDGVASYTYLVMPIRT